MFRTRRSKTVVAACGRTGFGGVLAILGVTGCVLGGVFAAATAGSITPPGAAVVAAAEASAAESGTATPPGNWQTIRMRVTAYCPCRKCCGEYADGITASGHRIRPGDRFVAADASLPFGTVVVVPGYNGGRAVKVLDRGGAIRGNRLDVFFNSHQQALEWGVKYLNVRVRTENRGQ